MNSTCTEMKKTCPKFLSISHGSTHHIKKLTDSKAQGSKKIRSIDQEGTGAWHEEMALIRGKKKFGKTQEHLSKNWIEDWRFGSSPSHLRPLKIVTLFSRKCWFKMKLKDQILMPKNIWSTRVIYLSNFQTRFASATSGPDVPIPSGHFE